MMVPAAGDKDACLGGGPCVALLVLAHAAPSVLAVTARIFDDPRFRIYVHLDRKADLDAYCGGHVWPGRLCFIEERYEIFWGGFNMVRATEALARAALADASNAVCCLISDDALPLWPCERVHEALVAVPDRIDLGLSRRNPPFLRRYTDFYFLDSRMTSARWLEVQERCVDPAGAGQVSVPGVLERVAVVESGPGGAGVDAGRVIGQSLAPGFFRVLGRSG